MTEIALEDEVPVTTLPDIENWSENYCFDAYDMKSGVGFWIHMGRWPADTRKWREQIYLMMPDGSYLLQRNVGFRPSDKGPSGALLDIECVKPGRTWRLRYSGPARRTSKEELLQGSVVEKPYDVLDMDIVFEASTPIWDFGHAVKGEVWASSHYEQSGRVRGTITAGGKTIRIDGGGHRDHSRGPRNQSQIYGHCWIHGHFPDGRSFALFDLRMREGGGVRQGVALGVMMDGKGVYPARYSEPPYLGAITDPPGSYAMRFESEIGVMDIKAQIERSLPISVDAFNDALLGVTVMPDTRLVAWEESTRFECDGLIGEGHTERTYHC